MVFDNAPSTFDRHAKRRLQTGKLSLTQVKDKKPEDLSGMQVHLFTYVP